MGSTEKESGKAYTVRLTENALQNIYEISGYITFINHQPLNAIRVGDKIFETIDHIGQHPYAFRQCEEIPTKNKIYRKAVCLSWLIIYKIKPSEIIILGIIHSSRKPSKITAIKKTR